MARRSQEGEAERNKAKESRAGKPTDVSSLQVEDISVPDKNIVCGRW
jgi:hypothetical protein